MTAVPGGETAALSGRIEDGVHRLWQRVYYEDTDAAGIVYYANYLRFAERGRTEILRLVGVSQAALRDRTGLAFAVHKVSVDYRRPARLDDLLEIRSAVTAMTRVRVSMKQTIRDAESGTVFAALTIDVVCIDAEGRPARVPSELAAAMRPLCRAEE